MVNHPNRNKQQEQAVVVTTESRGVFFGYAADISTVAVNKSLSLRAARNCLYWPSENKGFLGLASDGPKKGAKVGPAANVLLLNVTSVSECTPAAVDAWESAPWSR